jgi:hypothetical protein
MTGGSAEKYVAALLKWRDTGYEADTPSGALAEEFLHPGFGHPERLGDVGQGDACFAGRPHRFEAVFA